MYKLSILIAVYNDEQYLEECMDSLLSSTRQSVMYNAIHNNKVEILITNDHDNKDKEFIDIINKIKNKYTLPEDSIKYYINKENQGLLLNQCDMILKANGEYITFIDPDDHYNDNVYGEIFSVLNYTDIDKKPELVICNANVRYFENIFCEQLPFVWTRFYLSSVIKNVINVILSFNTNLKSFQLSNDILLNSIIINNISNKKRIILNHVKLINHSTGTNYLKFSSPETPQQAETTINNFLNFYTVSNKLFENGKITANVRDSLLMNINTQIHRFLLTSKCDINVRDMLYKQGHQLNDLLKNYQMLFSICITFYNKAKYVKSCIDSIINQNLNFDVIQLVIVNDCSTDNTDEEINKYINEHKDLNIKYIKHKENMGVFEARRTCINNADGEYSIFVDGDDEFVENKFGCWIESVFINSDIGRIDLYPTGRVLGYTDISKTSSEAEKEFNSFFKYPRIPNRLYEKGTDEYSKLMNFGIITSNTDYWKVFNFVTGHVIKTQLCHSVLNELKERYINFNYSEDSCLLRLVIDKLNYIFINIQPQFIFYKYNDFLTNNLSLTSKSYLNTHINKTIFEKQILVEFASMITAYNICAKYCETDSFKNFYKQEFANSLHMACSRQIVCKHYKELYSFLKKLLKLCDSKPELKNIVIGVINNPFNLTTSDVFNHVTKKYINLYQLHAIY